MTTRFSGGSSSATTRPRAGRRFPPPVSPTVSPPIRARAFDLVLVDYLLEDGSGHDFVQGVRETDLDVPILVVSGAFDIDALTGFVREAIDDVLPKPIDFTQLEEVTLRLSRLGRERRRMRRRAVALLEVSRNLKVGGDSKELLSRFVRAVSEITPFRRSAIYITESDTRLAFRAAVHGATNLPDRVPDRRTLQDVRARLQTRPRLLRARAP